MLEKLKVMEAQTKLDVMSEERIWIVNVSVSIKTVSINQKK